MIRTEFHNKNNYTELVFGCIDNVYTAVLRAKLSIFEEEKVIYIMDVYGFEYTVWDDVSIITMDNNIKLTKLINKYYNNYSIRNYDPDNFFVFNLTRKIFYNAIYYPTDLINYLNKDLIDYIHNFNIPKIKKLKRYNTKNIDSIWTKCDATNSDLGVLDIWFGHKI
jgi:hypothetical protein